MMEAFMKAMQAQRSEYHLTLGQLTKVLEECEKDVPVIIGNKFDTNLGSEYVSVGPIASYRGYYEDLAFQPSKEIITSKNLVLYCKSSILTEFQGYKGGSYLMDSRTPLWISNWGETSNVAIIYAKPYKEWIDDNCEITSIRLTVKQMDDD